MCVSTCLHYYEYAFNHNQFIHCFCCRVSTQAQLNFGLDSELYRLDYAEKKIAKANRKFTSDIVA